MPDYFESSPCTNLTAEAAIGKEGFEGNPTLEEVQAEIETLTAPLDWNGPNDPENPINWPKWERCWHIVPPAIISFAA